MGTPTLDAACAVAGRDPEELTRRDVALALLALPTGDRLATTAALRRELLAAGNPLSTRFWASCESLLARMAEGKATVGDVRRWLEATGSEPTQLLLPAGFVWDDEKERKPIAREMHAQLVTHLEGLVADGTIDPDPLLNGDPVAVSAYQQAQLQWLETPLVDGRQPLMVVSDEETDEFLAEWDAADADARLILSDLLADLEPPQCPEAELHAACERLRAGVAQTDRTYALLRDAGDLDPHAMPEGDRELWLQAAKGVVSPRHVPPEQNPYDDRGDAAWFAIDHADWIGAVVSLARAGPGAVADAESLAHQAATFDFEEVADEPDESWQYEPFLDEIAPSELEAHLTQGFFTVERLWRQLGVIDRDDRLTELGCWGLPEALLLAWQPSAEDQ